jgi:hypothetical protein
VPLFEEAHRRMRAVRGADDPETLAVLNNLAAGLQTAGQNERALPLLEDLLARRRATLPADHPDVVASLNNLAAAYRVANRPDRALPLCEEALRRTRTAYGEEHPYTFLAMGNLAGTCKALGRLDRALPLWDEVLRHLQATVGKDHPDALVTLNNLALGYQAAGRLDRAVPLLEAARQGFQAKLGTEHPATLLSLNNLAAGYQAAGQPDRALPLFREAAAGMERRQFRHAYAGGIVGGLVGCLEALGQDDQAEAWRRKWLAAVKEQAGPEAPAYAQELAGLGAYLLRRGQGSAAAVLREALAILARADPGGWGTAHVRVLLGTALLNEGKAAEAGPLLREGHQGLAAWEGKTLGPPPARLLAAAAALARLEEAGDRPLAASPFRAEAARRWAAELHRDLAWPLLWGWPVAR